MASLIPGYEYDIFISYRQKDNKGDRWVSEFVDALKTELESTFKEEISVYFDINPQDGLLETHDVDASLKDKLNCLVFIPIISRTYCDPKSFAWENEFKAFVERASRDLFGLKVKLPTGNVANRVLPIRIHDLDPDDIKLCEFVLGGILRGIEFIYKEQGVNKPLTANDNEKKNLNNTNYKIQINKTANAIKEIVSGLKARPVGSGIEKNQLKVAENKIHRETNIEEHDKPVKLKLIKLLSGFFISAILVITAIQVYPIIFKRNTLENLRSSGERISVAVMPFQNMTNDTSLNYLQEAIQDNLITFLTNYSKELIVRQVESINSFIRSKGLTNYASITSSVARTISKKLNANVFIYGSIKQMGSKIRVSAQLTDSKTNEVFKSFETDGLNNEEMIFPIIDSLRKQVTDFLVISKMQKELSTDFQESGFTNSPEAYRSYSYSLKAFLKYDYSTSLDWALKAYHADSNFLILMNDISFIYAQLGLIDEAKKWCGKFYERKDLMPESFKIRANRLHAVFFETPNETLKYLKQLQEIDNQSEDIAVDLGNCYNDLYQYDKAITEFEKALEICKKRDTKPMWCYDYTILGYAYHKTGQYKKENKTYKKAEKDFPDDPYLIYRQAILSLTQGDNKNGNSLIEKYRCLRKEDSWSETDITTSVAEIYSESNNFEKAEQYYRQVLSLVEITPDNSWYLNNLAYFLIDKDRNINEGIELVDKALVLIPDNYDFLNTKGWGLYKQGKYKEALDILQKSWDLRMKNAIYDHEAFLHLEAAKKAIADQKNN